MSKYTVIVSRRADMMLVKHAKFIARVSIPASRRFVHEFGLLLDTLEERPFSYPVEEDYGLPEGYRKALFAKWYKAIFTVEGDKVYLDTVLDGRQENAEYYPQ